MIPATIYISMQLVELAVLGGLSAAAGCVIGFLAGRRTR